MKVESFITWKSLALCDWRFQMNTIVAQNVSPEEGQW